MARHGLFLQCLQPAGEPRGRGVPREREADAAEGEDGEGRVAVHDAGGLVEMDERGVGCAESAAGLVVAPGVGAQVEDADGVGEAGSEGGEENGPLEEEEERVADAAGTAGRHEGGGLFLVQHLGVREGG